MICMLRVEMMIVSMHRLQHRKILINGDLTIYRIISTPGKSAPFWKTPKSKAYHVKKVLILFYHFVIFRRLHMAASESFSGFHFGFTSL